MTGIGYSYSNGRYPVRYHVIGSGGLIYSPQNESIMNIILVVDPDTQNQRTHEFNSDYEIEEIRWERFTDRPERIYAQQDAFVGDSIYPAIFLNTLTCTPHIVSILPDGRVYVSVETIPILGFGDSLAEVIDDRL